MAHTPGPWKLVWHGTEQYPYPLSVRTENNASWIARDGVASTEANARLIATAPDLLEALELAEEIFVSLMRPDSVPGENLLKIRKAIAKAKGETE